ncbi:MAG: hypothetical protein K2X57_07010 [Xanthobacteraceae bacterium]|nr:hypothetical protein [Xanthobacteraceae bacterium]
MPESLPRDIQLRRQYGARGYARHLSTQELNKRIRDIVVNITRVTSDAKVGPQQIKDGGGIWFERLIHILEEMQLRHGPYPAGFSRDIFRKEPFPNYASELAGKAARKLASLGIKTSDVYIKFGKQAHMEQLLRKGALRVQPASYFSNKDHNGAVRDDELSLQISLALSRDDIIKIVTNPEDVPPDAPEQRLDASLRSPTDFWLYCVTTATEARLFVDFQVDSCVIIRDQPRFRERLINATLNRFPDTVFHHAPAQYIDPLLPRTTKIFVPLAKYFGYSYQREYRFCWIPKAPVQKLSHADIEIGSLEDFSSLIVL